MKLFIIGATGKTGQIVTRMALRNGHDVTAFVRSPDKMESHNHLTVVKGNVASQMELSACIAGHDAVISCLGTEGMGPSTFLTEVAAALTPAMRDNGIQRIAYVASAGIHGEIDGLVGKLIMYMLRHVLKDHANAVTTLRDGGLSYTIARPMGLQDKAGKGTWRSAYEGLPPKPSRSISRDDVAAFLLDAIENGRHERESVAIAY
ncbi:NAD(P)-dependent oxidoreductase [Paenibacillus sp. YIM B09110]|uniref:NAD(P)-dependent oxidoreductase n=1 Tax=Paenibacillus sp. YIM B09110 TaxID=3126102 RepID=UPI00301BEF87